MNKKRGFIAYDVFKLIVAAILLFLIMILWVSFSKKVSPEDAAPVVTENNAADAANGADTAAEALPTPQADAETDLDLNLPDFPEANLDWNFDSAKGLLLNAAGDPLYRLSEDGKSWLPAIPDKLKSLKFAVDGDQWTLSDDTGIKYLWDAATHSWGEVTQEQAAEDTAAEDAAQDAAAEDNAAEDEVAAVESGDCAGVAPPRLVPGEKAEVLANVNFRSSPGIADNWVTTLYSGTQLKVLGENICLPYGNGAYRWWKLEQEDGTVGWMAEAPINGTNYFLAPVK